ncbi:P-loop nucleoside triphosphate hydrolases superfamily protein with CH (Calponin Homology) domain-containing protein [Actinidia rufa]|uniref:P-loop nucleoside triphosphate hydrolases superfamily protein with CH (Calponin Homology) domain-containing protein n=1 Tax=Actinidia rufa TaxID=165716 RepID=A0A7J0ERQ3_9ERIC|nr:P-loop nucleoside triphosphate hydrolases superfamily protein with CH (Calponin Homology) domain-containing protein [Actinidia rufa]
MTTTEGILPFSVASVVEGVLQQHGKRLSDIDLASRKAEEASLRRYEAARWLRKTVGVVGGKDLPAEPSEEEFRLGLRSGIILCNAINKVQSGAIPKVVEAPSDSVIVPDGAALSAYQYFENVRNFLVAVEEMGLPTFEASDLEQGGKSSRIVNCVLALKSYDDWKRGGGNGLWKFGGNLKPIAFGKYFVRKNSEPFMSSLRNLTSEKSLDSISSEQSLCGDLGNDLNEMGNSHSLHMLVRELISDKKPEEIPFIVENMIGKVMEEFEHRLAGQNEQMRTTLRDEDVSDPNKALSKSSFGDIEELKHTLHTAKADLHFLQIKYQEEVNNLGVHLHGLAYAASGYQRVLEENRKLYNHVQDLKGSIRVYCRVRPFLPGQPNSVSTVGHLDEGSISIITPLKYVKDGRKSFTFNKVFGPSATQEEVFSDTQPLIRSVLDGYNVCIFAYGQTGTGKTHTMTGPKELTQKSVGVNYRALSDLFLISEQRKNTISYEVSVQMIEIYNEQIRDLLATDDLAGSERVDKSEAVGDRLKEALHINKSLSALGDVISSLAQKNSHVPYRNSKLTQLLQDSLGGQAKTLMFVHISPEPDAAGETISTLKFADRVSTVELGAARVNKDGADVKELKEQIANLKAALARKEGEPGSLHSALSSTEIQSMNSAGTSPSHPILAEFRGCFRWPEATNGGCCLASKEDVREAAGSGDWVDKVMLNRQAGLRNNEDNRQLPEMFYQRHTPDPSKIYPEQSLNKLSGNRQDCQDNDVNRNRYETATTDDSDDLEAATSDSSETDLLWQLNLPKVSSIPNGLGSKTKKPNPKQTKSSEFRSLIPAPPTRRLSNGHISPLHKTGRQPVPVDGKRKIGIGK